MRGCGISLSLAEGFCRALAVSGDQRHEVCRESLIVNVFEVSKGRCMVSLYLPNNNKTRQERV